MTAHCIQALPTLAATPVCNKPLDSEFSLSHLQNPGVEHVISPGCFEDSQISAGTPVSEIQHSLLLFLENVPVEV
jgi:hypothetical protein